MWSSDCRRLHLYDACHIVIDRGRRRFIRLVDYQLYSGLHHRCWHWLNVHRTPLLAQRLPQMPSSFLRFVKKRGERARKSIHTTACRSASSW
jgi:hypothetical protein